MICTIVRIRPVRCEMQKVVKALTIPCFTLFDFCSHVDCSQPSPSPIYDVAVVGGGVVGLAVARACATTKSSVILIEKEDSVGAGVSSRNSGLGCTGYDAPIGSLERALLRRSIRLHQNLYRSFGLSTEHVRKSGSLVVAWTEKELLLLPKILEENRSAGDLEARLLTKFELLQFEPSLSKNALGAIFCPYEAVVEPWLVLMGYAESCRLHGVTISTGIVLPLSYYS
jgi:glycerol-3-phosphate dehydrogenase